jgi:hypothetical protein
MIDHTTAMKIIILVSILLAARSVFHFALHFDGTASCCVSLVLFLVILDDATDCPSSLVHASINFDQFIIPTNCIFVTSYYRIQMVPRES